MKLTFKFNAQKVDEIEQAKKVPIENCITDTSVNTLILFIQKAVVDENGQYGVSKNVAMDMLNQYLEESDKDNLVLDITEALVNAGFLSRKINVEDMRALMNRKQEELSTQMGNL